MLEGKGPNCFQCKYFFITWDPKNPRGCKYFKFKSKALPSTIVLKSSGDNCVAFKPKDK